MPVMGSLGPTHSKKSPLSLNSLQFWGQDRERRQRFKALEKRAGTQRDFQRHGSQGSGESLCGADPQLHQHPPDTALPRSLTAPSGAARSKPITQRGAGICRSWGEVATWPCLQQLRSELSVFAHKQYARQDLASSLN